jgi:hypothetical protein
VAETGIVGELDRPITDEELTALALAADPDQAPDPDAVPLADYLGETSELLPSWYMAPVGTARAGRWQRLVILAVIAAFIGIEAVGLCSTYGQIPFH